MGIPYGIASGSTVKDIGFSSGRELFRCGATVKMYITNVSCDIGDTSLDCGSITGAAQEGACLQSAQISWKDQSSVNWEAKTGVTSDTDSGSVITKVGECAGGTIYTHTEGQCQVRVQCSPDLLKTPASAQSAAITAMGQMPGTGGGRTLEWFLSDISVQASPTDWFGGNITLSGFGTGGSNAYYRSSFNWQNGRSESTSGKTEYDNTDEKSMIQVITSLAG